MEDSQPTRNRALSRRRILVGLSAAPLVALGACGGDSDGKKTTKTPESASTVAPSASSVTSVAPGARATASVATASAAASAQPTTSSYFPPPTGTWETIDAQKAGFSSAGLEKITTLVRDTNGGTFMMLAGGRILVESYFSTVNADSHFDVASVQKSVVSTLIGIAREKGLLALDDFVSKYLPAGWSKASAAEEAKITIRHLMTHSSGLDPKTLRKVAEPGTKYDYNTDAYQKTRPILEKVSGMEITKLTHAWVLDPIGASATAAWVIREGEKDATGAQQWGFSLSARDMARFGLLSIRRGNWAGTALIKPAWYDEAWAPSKVKADYGLLWWLMGRGTLAKVGAPRDLVAALGAMDQKIYVVPSQDLVVTRQGRAAAEDSEAESDFDKVLFKAIAAARL